MAPMNAKEIRKMVYRSIAAVTKSTDLGSIVGEEVFNNLPIRLSPKPQLVAS